MCPLVARITVAVGVLGSLAGCLSSCREPILLTPDDIPAIQLGMTLDELADALEGCTPAQFDARKSRHNKTVYRTKAKYERLLTHQFTIVGDDTEVLQCVRSTVIRPTFLFLFSDGELLTIWHSRGMQGAAEPEHAVRSILATEPVDLDGFAGIIQRAVERGNYARQYSEPPPIPIWLWQLGSTSELRERAMLFDKLDGLKLNLDMSPDEVMAVFGEPIVSQMESVNEVLWVYNAQPKRSYRQIRVSIRFESDRVIAIYTQEYGRPTSAHVDSDGT